jgi:hypothetical protein
MQIAEATESPHQGVARAGETSLFRQLRTQSHGEKLLKRRALLGGGRFGLAEERSRVSTVVYNLPLSHKYGFVSLAGKRITTKLGPEIRI